VFQRICVIRGIQNFSQHDLDGTEAALRQLKEAFSAANINLEEAA
jgi:hypothetical protein